jgi:hypothetical protein
VEKINMTPNLSSFADELTKVALVFGASPHENADWAEVPYAQRLKSHKSYVTAKANERPTGFGKAMAVGGAIGAGSGGLLGLLARHGVEPRAAHGIVGTLIGGLLGIGGGALAAHFDKGNIASARAALKANAIDQHLHNEIKSRRESAAISADRDRRMLRDIHQSTRK